MTAPVRHVAVHTVLNSGGGPAAEAEVMLADGCEGRGSAPVAIKAGVREVQRTNGLTVGVPIPERIAHELRGLAEADTNDQSTVDSWLSDRVHLLGTDVMLAVSLAYARAAARSAGVSLTSHFARLARTRPTFPGLLVAVVSGGIHGSAGLPFQQIMLASRCTPPSRVIPQVMEIYGRVEQILFDAGHAIGHSASSGILVTRTGAATAFDVVDQAITDLGMTGEVGIAIDVAAEHLHDNGGYRVDGQLINADQLGKRIEDLANRYQVAMVEDPFVAEHRHEWEQLTSALRGKTTVIGDDLFASNSRFLDPALADGVLLKMNQVGTITETIHTAVHAKEAGMVTAVSHRSLETEDTAVCDLAVALGARWIKVGGPRRGDRVAKYNQLLRLERTPLAGL